MSKNTKVSYLDVLNYYLDQGCSEEDATFLTQAEFGIDKD